MSIEAIVDEIRSMALPELKDLSESLTEQIHVAEVAASASEELDKIVRNRSESRGLRVGDPWVRPTEALEAYPTEAVVTHNGKTWRNLTPANVWEPGVSGWREISPEDAVPPNYVPPTGAHDAYAKGDRVSYDGAVWRSSIDGNVWSPDELVRSWTREVILGNTPDESSGSVPEWTQPTGSHDAYSIGDQVIFSGKTYSSTIDGNSWSPSDYPPGWDLVS